MEKSRNIFAWLGQREEREILNDALKHVEKSLLCVKEMKNSIEAFYENNKEEKDRAISKVKEAEHEGDEIRKKMNVELSKGLLLPPDREDLILLNESLNNIADGAKGIVRLLEFLEKPPLPELCKQILEDSLLAVKAAEKLKEAIDALIKNDIEKVLEDCAQIETLEEEGDDKRRELLGSLVKTDLKGALLLLIYEIIDMVENLIDDIKDAAGHVRILAIKAK